MLITLIAFVVLLSFGVSLDELTWVQAVLLVLFAVVVCTVIILLQWPPLVIFSTLAFMDAILVIVIFKGDIPIW